jgi:hypothetical protein
MHPKMSVLLLSALASSILLGGVATASADNRGNRGFSLRDIRGDYSVTFEGEVTEGPVVGHAVAAGLGRSDGKGNLRVNRTININGTLILEQTGVCTYTVEPSGAGKASCTFSAPGVPDSSETYALVIVDHTEVDYISTTPGIAVLGVGKKQKRGSDD